MTLLKKKYILMMKIGKDFYNYYEYKYININVKTNLRNKNKI